jgi:predicted phage terminase large subunit-like protein
LKEKWLRIKRAKSNIGFFACYYLSHYMPYPSAAFHKELFQMAQEDKKGKRIAIAAPRGHAKSTILSLIFPLWCIISRRKRFIIIVSDTIYQASLHLSAIINELEQNEKLKKDFGSLIGSEKWTQTDILTANGIRLVAKGTGSKLRGLRNLDVRPDLIVCDDLENDELVSTLEQRKKIYQWFTRALINTMDPEGDIVTIGTIIHYDSLLIKLLKKPGWNSAIYRAIKDDGTPLWPEKWDMQKLEQRKKEIGTVAFNSEYMNDPADPDTQIFQPNWFHFYQAKDIENLNLSVYGALDPALSQHERADYSAFITIGIADDGRIFVLDADLCRLSPRALIDKLFFKFSRFHHLLIALETVAFQDVLRRWIEDLSSEQKIYLPMKEVKHSSDKIRRITRLSPLFERGLIYLQHDQQLLLEQLEHFPRAAHDDGPDALEMAVDIARHNIAYLDHIDEPDTEELLGI